MRRKRFKPTDLNTSRDYSIVAVAFKTVEMFEGLTGRKLWLKNGQQQARTNGNLIEVPFKHPEMYRLVEYQLAHILFKSDPDARAAFVKEYARHVQATVLKHRPKHDTRTAEAIAPVMDLFVGTLEAERILSLWDLVYEGSATIIRQQRRDVATAITAEDLGLAGYFVAIANGISLVVPDFEKYRPIFEEALARVRLRGFDATLLTAKWLLAKIVDQILKDASEAPLAEARQEKTGATGAGAGAGEEQAVSRDTEAGGAKPAASGEAGERTEALLDALDELHDASSPGGPDHNDFQSSELTHPAIKAAAEAMAMRVLGTAVKDGAALDRALDNSRQEMRQIVEKVRNAVRKSPEPDEWLRKDAMAKVIIRDITSADVERDPELSDEDREAIDRLRTQFLRVMGKRKFALEDLGYEIDVPALVERKLTGIPLPVFRGEATGRGFRALMLLDRSESMKGKRTAQAERSARVINRALDFPFVTTETWGFQSLLNGQFDLTRYAPDVEQFDTARSGVGGVTPLHIAIRLATRHLERVTDSRHLFVVTDGAPVWMTKEGRAVPRPILLKQTRENVLLARSKGINVVGVLIRNAQVELSDAEMRFMFGHSKWWRIVEEKTFARDLVRLVATSFVEYLKFA